MWSIITLESFIQCFSGKSFSQTRPYTEVDLGHGVIMGTWEQSGVTLFGGAWLLPTLLISMLVVVCLLFMTQQKALAMSIAKRAVADPPSKTLASSPVARRYEELLDCLELVLTRYCPHVERRELRVGDDTGLGHVGPLGVGTSFSAPGLFIAVCPTRGDLFWACVISEDTGHVLIKPDPKGNSLESVVGLIELAFRKGQAQWALRAMGQDEASYHYIGVPTPQFEVEHG